MNSARFLGFNITVHLVRWLKLLQQVLVSFYRGAIESILTGEHRNPACLVLGPRTGRLRSRRLKPARTSLLPINGTLVIRVKLAPKTKGSLSRLAEKEMLISPLCATEVPKCIMQTVVHVLVNLSLCCVNVSCLISQLMSNTLTSRVSNVVPASEKV